MQTLYAYSLAPVQETWSDRKSFANRLGRSTLDADYYIREIYSGKDAPPWVVRADVKKCYESLKHEWFIENVPMAYNVLVEFLKARYFLDDKYYDVDRGIGLGSRLSPFLANFALDGLQSHIYRRLDGTDEPVDEDNGNMIRFVDDILVSARSYEEAVMIRQYIREFLGVRGLELSKEKTAIIPISSGFDFLGRHYEKKGEVMMSCPSAASVEKFKKTIEEFILNHKGSPESIVEELNHKISRFASHHRMTNAEEAFREIDIHICTCLLQLCDKFFGKENRENYKRDYWITRGNTMQFVVKGSPHIRVRLLTDSIWIKYKPLDLKLNPYINYEAYDRRRGDRDIRNVNGVYKRIWEGQKGCCEYCRRPILPDDEKELVEIDSTAGKKEDRLGYIHSRCSKMNFDAEFSESEYLEECSTIKLLLQYADACGERKKTEENPLYLFFKESKDRTVRIKIEDIATLYGEPIDSEAAKKPEFWVRGSEDGLGSCWHKNGYFFAGYATKTARKVVFRKIEYKGDEVSLQLPDILANGKIKPRTALKLRESIEYILKQDRYPAY